MPLFDFGKNLIGIPDEWKQTRGKNVKIALLDTGANLSHEALQHLDISGRKFDVTLPHFDIETAIGEDVVEDTAPSSNLHGTQLLSIIAANPIDETGVRGIAPEATIFIIKIIDNQFKTIASNFLKAIELCEKLDVDIICNSSFPRKDDVSIIPKIEEAIQRLIAKNTIFVSALKNTSLPARFNKIVFPTNIENALVTGVPQRAMLKKADANFQFEERIHCVFPELKVTTIGNAKGSTGKTFSARSSHAVAGLSGILALYLSYEQSKSDEFSRPTRQTILSELEKHCPAFSKNDFLNGSAKFQFSKT